MAGSNWAYELGGVVLFPEADKFLYLSEYLVSIKHATEHV